ncbi:nucleotidyltransferase domain-containing protein [Actinoplanes couchii]|uniref:Nucleotidyltransferase domain-containing protein n=1 Tax=Actinoplanes couchii TaxID=403638 RepID=A0ABQ3XMQ6_9ACTN|nr:nucleotidyltransferase domain-containing protein [Actinoplanes couchii]MDR6317797.1 hypothetical protein [Actinoplanes couchii]GID59786.1 hypothetical protein Aco03nite_081900 [Actinoplanes couchii]
MRPSVRWRQLLDERVDEAVTYLGRAPGVSGFLIGGSIGRGEPWPMSDIDLLPVYPGDTPPDGPPPALDQRRADLVDWWTGSGRAQALDLARLCFTVGEIGPAMRGGPEWVAGRMGEHRWFHGSDKAYGARPVVSGDDPADAVIGEFAEWLTGVRFHPAVVAARLTEWRRQAEVAWAEADRLQGEDPVTATYHLRESARAYRMILIEGWGDRLGSMGREWTRFERMAAGNGQADLAGRVAVLAGADARDAADRARIAPIWLRERIGFCWAARREVGEDVTEEQNARDQLAAYTLHVVRKRPELDGPWTASPDPLLGRHLTELRQLLTASLS